MKSLKGIALGTFPFANVFGKINENDAYSIVKEFIENEGEFLHVSLVYNNTEVEKMLGKILKKFPRDSYKIMACCGWGIKNDNLSLSGKPEDVEWCCNGLLKRMGLDYVDILMSHGPDVNTPYELTADAMKTMKKTGKAKDLCVSNVSLEQLRRYNTEGEISYIQNRFSLLNQSISDELFKYCKDNKIKITTYQSIERGLLTDRILNVFSIDENDLRSKKPEFNPEKVALISSWVRKNILPISESCGVPIQTLVLYWTLHAQNIYATVCGISKAKYFKDYYAVNSINVSDETILAIDSAYADLEKYVLENYNSSIKSYLGI